MEPESTLRGFISGQKAMNFSSHEKKLWATCWVCDVSLKKYFDLCRKTNINLWIKYIFTIPYFWNDLKLNRTSWKIYIMYYFFLYFYLCDKAKKSVQQNSVMWLQDSISGHAYKQLLCAISNKPQLTTCSNLQKKQRKNLQNFLWNNPWIIIKSGIYFLRRMWFWGFGAKSGPQLAKVFQVLSNIDTWSFSDFAWSCSGMNA